MWTGAGEWIWRPLVNPATLHTNSFMDNNPRGFGLVQRERSFGQYQDDGVVLREAPFGMGGAARPLGCRACDAGGDPTLEETDGQYRRVLESGAEAAEGSGAAVWLQAVLVPRRSVSSGLATVRATRDGIGGVVGQKRTYFSWRFVVDFAGGDFGEINERADVMPVITASRGQGGDHLGAAAALDQWLARDV